MARKTARKRPVFLDLRRALPGVELAGCYHFTEPTSFEYRVSGHHFILVQTGQLDAHTVAGDCTATRHDLVYFRPAPVNRYAVAAGTIFYQASVRGAAGPDERLPLGVDPTGPLPIRMATGQGFEELRTSFETLCMELNEPGAAHELRCVAGVYRLFAWMAQAQAAAAESIAALDRIDRARLQLESELDTAPKAEDIAREMCMCPDHFIRRFKGRFGLTPKAFQIRVRVREAVRLLRDTDMSVKQVALRLGWHDAKTLAGHLRSILARSPTEIRAGGPPSDVALPGRELYSVNLHVVPPEAGPDYFDRWMLPGRRDRTTQASTARLRQRHRPGC